MINLIVPDKALSSVKNLMVLEHPEFTIKPFSDLTITFLNELSREILRHAELRKEPAFAALGFWLRKSNIKSILAENNAFFENKKFKTEPLGVVFHVCPSNVDTMFFYSLVIALLAGNKNIVRISSKLDHPLMFTLFETINAILAKSDFATFANYINIVKYDRNDEINKEISINSDGRIIWGGDETVQQFKLYPTKPKVKDLFFADRVSYSLIKTEFANYLHKEEYDLLIQNLYNDIYTFDQKGCSSPHCIFLLGDEKENLNFLKKAYHSISDYAQDNYEIDVGSIATFKFNQIAEDIIDSKISKSIHENNYLIFSELKEKIVPETCGTGYLYYVHINGLNDLKEYINNKVQSIGYFGFSKEELNQLADTSYAKGVDRIVPVGKALEFDYIWDGYNILTEMVSLKSVK